MAATHPLHSCRQLHGAVGQLAFMAIGMSIAIVTGPVGETTAPGFTQEVPGTLAVAIDHVPRQQGAGGIEEHAGRPLRPFQNALGHAQPTGGTYN